MPFVRVHTWTSIALRAAACHEGHICIKKNRKQQQQQQQQQHMPELKGGHSYV